LFPTHISLIHEIAGCGFQLPIHKAITPPESPHGPVHRGRLGLKTECLDFNGIQRVASIKINTAGVPAKEKMQINLLRQRCSVTACK